MKTKRIILLVNYFYLIFLFGCNELKIEPKKNHEDLSFGITISTNNENLTNPNIAYLLGFGNKIFTQDIMENYASMVLETFDQVLKLVLKIEGNFTNSGNKEVICFYESQHPRITLGTLKVIFCFIYDNDEKSINNIYKIDWSGTIEFEDEFESNIKLDDYSGYYIIWKDRIIGYYGDFNKNGIDELYLFKLSGMNFKPYIYEFNGDEFVNILKIDFWVDNSSIISINPDENTISFKFIQTPDIPGIFLRNILLIHINGIIPLGSMN